MVSSQAIAASSHHSWFWAKPGSGRLRSPLSFTLRTRPGRVRIVYTSSEQES